MSNSPADEQDFELLAAAARSLEEARPRLKRIADEKKSNQYGVEVTLHSAQLALRRA